MSSALRRPTPNHQAVVPDDYGTIQEAIHAVQGSSDARVQIDSNETFEESLTITDSVEIAAGEGFHPTIRGRIGARQGAIPGRSVVDFRPANPLGAVLDLYGLTILPAPSAGRGDRIVQVWNRGSGVAQLNLCHVELDNRASGADGIVVRQLLGKGAVVACIEDSLLRLGGDMPANALSFRGAGTVTFERSRVVMNALANRGLVVSGPNASGARLLVRDSTFEIEIGQAQLASTHLLLENVAAQVEANRFVSRSVAGGWIVGVALHGASSISCPVDLHRNDFSHQGGGRATAVRAAPQPFRILALRASNNFLSDQTEGFSFRPAARGYASAALADDTVDRSRGDAVSAQTDDSGVVALRLSSNHLTRNGGYGVHLDRRGGSLSFRGEANVYFHNELGDVHPPAAADGAGEVDLD